MPFLLPTREERDRLLAVDYGSDPAPPRCALAGHGDPNAHRSSCDTCRQFNRWRERMYDRFRRRGLRFVPSEHTFDDAEPPRCPLGHSDTPANRKNCQHCKTWRNWQGRQYTRMRRAGVDRCFTDLGALTAHLDALEDAGMVAADIARAAQCGKSTVQKLLGGLDGRSFVREDLARRLLAVPVPERRIQLVPTIDGRRIRRVDATGTRRRVQAAARAGHSMARQSRRLGWSDFTVKSWMHASTVTVDQAEAVATLFPSLIARPGPDRAAATMAAQKRWVEARYFSPSNIDDPGYDPFQIIQNPRGVYRRLRALAWDGQGPAEVAEFIGEAPEQVEIWMEGGPAPAYAHHMVAAAYEALAGKEGADQRAADRARHMGWAPWPAWEGIDIDYRYARPCYDLPSGVRKTDHPLDSQVWLALMGRIGQTELLHQERVRAVRFLHKLGWSHRRIAAWLRWNCDGDLDKGMEAVAKFCENNGITGYGMALHGVPGRDAAEDAIVVPGAA